MEGGLYNKTVYQVMAAAVATMALLAACQTTNPGGISSSSTTQAAGTPGPTVATSGGRISQAFYLPFYDQAAHMRSLVEGGNFDAAATLYSEQKAFFDEPESKARYAELLNRVAAYFNEKVQAGLAAAAATLEGVDWPASLPAWPGLRVSVANAENALAAYPDLDILKAPERVEPTVTKLRERLEAMKRRLEDDAAGAFVAFDHFGPSSFFESYPLSVDPGPLLDIKFDEVSRKVSSASLEQIGQFATNYPKKMIGEDRWRRIGEAYVARVLESRGRARDLGSILAAIRGAASLGFSVSTVPGATIALVEATSQTLLRHGQIEFPAAIEIDLPIKVGKAALDHALDDATAQTADYLIVLDVALAKASRRVTTSDEKPSRVVTGYRTVPNPEYNLAQNEMNRAQVQAQSAAMQSASTNAQYCYGVGCFGKALAQIASGAAEAAANSAMNKAMEKLQATPMTIEQPIYGDYSYTIASVSAAKTMTVRYYVIDKSRRTYFKSTFDVVEKKTFSIAYNISDKDPNKTEHLKNAQTEQSVVDWEEAPSSIKISQIVDHYLKNDSRKRPLPDSAALRREMLEDKNRGIAKYEANTFDSRPLNDPRFDSVVVVYSSAKQSLGTGFYVTPDTILTNWHVVKEGAFVEMKTYNKQETFGKVFAKDIRLDLALIRVQSRGKPVRWYSAKTLDPGKTVEAIGHPKGFEFSVTRGVISAIRRHQTINLESRATGTGKGALAGDGVLFIQTDTPINPGNSGGPLFLGDHVIGVNTWGVGKTVAEGLNFAVHYSEVRNFLSEHISGYQANAGE